MEHMADTNVQLEKSTQHSSLPSELVGTKGKVGLTCHNVILKQTIKSLNFLPSIFSQLMLTLNTFEIP